MHDCLLRYLIFLDPSSDKTIYNLSLALLKTALMMTMVSHILVTKIYRDDITKVYILGNESLTTPFINL